MIRVEDNGLGMTSEQLSVFEYMVSEDNGSEQTKMQNLKVNQERRGLGLRAWLTGFAFSTGIITVYSYAQAAPAAPLYNASYPIMTGEGDMLKALLVDDEAPILNNLSKVLPWEEMGMKVVGLARSGMEALEVADQYNPDLILCDIRMPVMDGLTFITKIREKGSRAEIFC